MLKARIEHDEDDSSAAPTPGEEGHGGGEWECLRCGEGVTSCERVLGGDGDEDRAGNSMYGSGEEGSTGQEGYDSGL